jgi:hypothetical protein
MPIGTFPIAKVLYRELRRVGLTRPPSPIHFARLCTALPFRHRTPYRWGESLWPYRP